ncbi:DEAD/DEAH box helicase [Lederbergia graminis]|uniref:DEAD/DEAH box helicase n=1 Tax=Lederbergia graminis TaxID=735518 RepID=A0ABW0LLN2_9BACI
MVLHCVVKQERFVVTNVTTRPAHIPVQSNWRLPVHLTFDHKTLWNEPISVELLNLINRMPVAKEFSTYVKKRIASWEGYLKIQERAADIPDMISRYSRLIFNDDFSRVTITGCQLKDQEWKSLKDLSVKLKGMDQEIGKVLKANRSAATVEVELSKHMEQRAREQRLDTQSKEVIFSNFATLSQVKRLRQGFKQLENGLAANPELERLLFENKPPVKEVKRKENLQFHNRLNEFQQEAVIGAVSAEDLYVIQGPPGTGKTTVISEICLQNARAGLRTLVASQSNLAVDNALGRLLANKDIRILRVGRTESIEEEGKKFIEENVGQYWKDHTLQEVSTQYETRKRREQEIDEEWTANEQEQERIDEELPRVEAQLAAKKEAEQQMKEILAGIDQLKMDLETAEKQYEEALTHVQEIRRSLQELIDSIEKDRAFLATKPDKLEIQQQSEALHQEITQLQHSIVFQELLDEINEKRQTIERMTADVENWMGIVEETDAVIARISDASKVDSLKWIILERNIKRSPRVLQLIAELDGLREKNSQLSKLKTYNDTLNRAIAYVEQLLKKGNVSIAQIQQRMSQTNPAATNSTEIDQFLENMRSELRNGPVYPKRLVQFLEGLYARRRYVWERVQRSKPDNTSIQKAQQAFRFLKQELIVQFQPVQNDNKMTLQHVQREKEELTAKLTTLQLKQKDMQGSVELITNAKALLQETKAKLHDLEKKQAEYEQAKGRLEANEQKRTSDELQLVEIEKQQAQQESRLEQLHGLLKEEEDKLTPLQEIIQTEPEREHEQLLRKLASVSFTRESLKDEKQKLPTFQSIQGKWLSLLQEASDHDLNEIRKLYVKHANVIGTTCVASARKDFIDSYPEFDVVIIDEVSKATPPELLLPMLKGKKIILVGDHHQLPPLLGDDTLEETLQELADDNEDFEGKAELKQLLHESLFERLFKNLPKTNKTMLAIQYRMHENIMSTITQFYEQENEGLRCGLANSDVDRDHMLVSRHIERHNHLLWLDMPNETPFYEARMKGGKSLYNQAELDRIAELLVELDEAVTQAKQAGRIDDNEKKSIGVISFYGEQVKRIDRLIHQELRLPNLTIRTGTVDKFQGMEMDVILLSMVRNHDNNDSIGFARDYRRLNVALSRARELLVLIGSTKMFTERTKQKDTRLMYTNVLDAVKKQNGLRMLEEVSVHG